MHSNDVVLFSLLTIYKNGCPNMPIGSVHSMIHYITITIIVIQISCNGIVIV